MKEQDSLAGEIDYGRYARLLFDRKKTIAAVTLVFVLTSGLISLLLPRTYESNALVQLGRFRVTEVELVYNALETKTIFTSSPVLDPVRLKYSKEKEISLEELRSRINVEIVKEEIAYRQTILAPQLNITLEANDALEARDMLSDVITSFFEYVNERLNEIKQPILLEYNETVRLAEIDYNKTIENIDDQIAEKDLIIDDLEQDIAEIEDLMKSLTPEDLSTEGVSKTTVLASIHSELKKNLVEEKNAKLALERQKVSKELAYESTLKNARITLEKELSMIQDFKVMSQPQVPESYVSPNLKVNLALSFIIGFLFSCALVLLQDARKTTTRKE